MLSGGFVLFSILVVTLGIGPFNDASWQSTFCKIKVFGLGNLIECDNMKDTLTLRGGSSITITRDVATDTVTIASNATSLKADNQTVGRKEFIVGYNNQTGDWTVRTFAHYNTTCTGNSFLKQVNNQTGVTVCANPAAGGSGNATAFTDLSDVVITSPAYGHIVQVVNGYWQNKLFKSNTVTCSGTDKVSGYDNQTGLYTCTADISGSGGFTKVNNVGIGPFMLVAKNQSNTADIKSVTLGQGLSGINGSTAITLQTSFKADNQTVGRKEFIVGYNNQTGDWTQRTFGVYNTTCNGNKFISQINNATGFTVCGTPSGSASSLKIDNQTSDRRQFITGINNATGDITRVTFAINNQTVSKDFQIVGINNVTGVITRNQFSINNDTNNDGGDLFLVGLNNATGEVVSKKFSVNLKTCSGTDKVSSIDNSTGNVICTTDTGGSGSDAMPTKRWGSFVPTTSSTVGNGFLTTSLTLEGVETLIYNSTSSTNTLGISSTTPATGGFRWAGLIQNATNAFNIYTGAQNPYTYIHAAPSTKTVNNAKFFIGFKSNQTPLPRGDDLIVNGISAVGICTRTTDTNYMLCYNDGSGAGTYTSMAVADNTSWHRFEVYTTDSGVTWCGKIDGGTAVCTTTDIPATTTRMYWQALLINHPQNIARIFQYGYVYVQNDR